VGLATSSATDSFVCYNTTSFQLTYGGCQVKNSLAFASGQSLGSTATPPQNLFFYGSGTFGSNSVEITGTPTGNNVWTVPNTATDTFAGLGTAQTFTATQTLTFAPAANTTTDGMRLYDTTMATTGNQQYSPSIHWQGQGYATTPAASQAVDWLAYEIPVQGAANPTSELMFASQVNGGGYTPQMYITSAGGEILAGSLTTIASIAAGASNAIGFTGRSFFKSPANAQMAITNSAATGVGIATTGSSDLPACYNATSFQLTYGAGCSGGPVSTGTKFTTSGCSVSATTGGATAGTYTSGTTGTCAVTVTMNGATGQTAPNGWTCYAQDVTTPADAQTQTTTTATAAVISGTTVSGDVVRFHCVGY
jgi:hypothetical protein